MNNTELIKTQMNWYVTGQGRAGQGRAGQGRAGQGRAGQGRQVDNLVATWTKCSRMKGMSDERGKGSSCQFIYLIFLYFLPHFSLSPFPPPPPPFFFPFQNQEHKINGIYQ